MPVTDIVEKLKAAADACTCGPTVVCEEAASEIERLRSRVAALEERLEIDIAYSIVDGQMKPFTIPPAARDTFPDGITVRDETIKLLDENIERLRSALAAAREECAKVRKAAREGTLG